MTDGWGLPLRLLETPTILSARDRGPSESRHSLASCNMAFQRSVSAFYFTSVCLISVSFAVRGEETKSVDRFAGAKK